MILIMYKEQSKLRSLLTTLLESGKTEANWTYPRLYHYEIVRHTQICVSTR